MNCLHECNPGKCSAADGERRKADVLDLLESRREVYVRRGRRAMLQKMLDGDGSATADDVRAAVELPPGIDPRLLGSVPGRLAYDRIISPAGFVRSTRPERHVSFIQVWALANREAALQWLADHPDLPDLDESEGAAGSQRVLFSLTQETAMPTGEAVGIA